MSVLRTLLNALLRSNVSKHANTSLFFHSAMYFHTLVQRINLTDVLAKSVLSRTEQIIISLKSTSLVAHILSSTFPNVAKTKVGW